jgi:hypothetical protein
VTNYAEFRRLIIHLHIIPARKDVRQVEEELGSCSMSRANLELREEPIQILAIPNCASK